MNQFVLAYIAQRMKEMGFENYTFEPVRVNSALTSVSVNATNEYFYLIPKYIASNTLIIRSDTNIFSQAATNYNDFNLLGIQEFTGIVTLSDTAFADFPIDYEFIRVIPRTALDCEKQKILEDYIQTVQL